MNVSLSKLSLFLALLLVPLVHWGQVTQVFLETYEDVPVSHTIVSTPNPPTRAINAEYGTVTVLQLDPLDQTYQITYTPNLGYIGADHFRYLIWTAQGALQFVNFEVTVSPAIVEAKRDYAVAISGQPVAIDVLANDFSSTGIKILSATPYVDHGTSELDGGTVTFTPDADYTGIAHLNYVICNESGQCDEGTVSITVLDASGSSNTIKVFTKRDEAQYIFAPPSFTVTQAPVNGTFVRGGGIPTYLPNQGYTGTDLLTVSGEGHDLIFDIEVLDIADNTFAFDDQAYTIVNGVTNINVLSNDTYGTLAECISFQQPKFGTVAPAGNTAALKGRFIYTPPTGFVGVDEFTYTSHPVGQGCNGQAETATVRIFVSNFEPGFGTFRMMTPRQTPMIISYEVPADSYEFQVTQQGTLGRAVYLAGPVDTTIYGLKVVGENLLVYIPDAAVTSGLDNLQITYCLRDGITGDCSVTKEVKVEMEIVDVGMTGPGCVGDCVWPGDTNFDGIVNMQDLLPIGLFMGQMGAVRAGATLDFWYGQDAEDWSRTVQQANGVDLKHIDTDGDGIVSVGDTVALNRFYDHTHTMVPTDLPYADFELFLEGDVFADPGDLIELKLILGTSAKPAQNVQGFVFDFPYDPAFFDPGKISLYYRTDSWLAYDSPTLSMNRNNPSAGSLETGFTRTGNFPATGYGEIGTLGVVIQEEVIGFLEEVDGQNLEARNSFEIELGDRTAMVMDGAGNMFSVYIHPFKLTIQRPSDLPSIGNVPIINPEDDLKVFPNPVDNQVTVHHNNSQTFQRVKLTDLQGRIVMELGGLDTNHQVINTAGLANGIYTLSVTNQEGTIHRKVEILH